MNAPNVPASYGAVERFQQPVPKEYNKAAFKLAWDWVAAIIHPHWKNAKIKTFDEILDMADIEFKGKSAGMPWNLAGIPFKEELYHDEECRKWIEEHWVAKLTKCASMAHVTVKKEILPQKKLLQNRLRNVIAVDGGHNMWMQMACYDAHHRLQRFPIDSMTALGWSPYRSGMQKLAEYLGKHPNGWEIDGGAWESHMFEECLWEIAKLKFEALCPEDQTDENRIRINNLYRMIARLPLVMPDGHAFLKGAKGSGGNLTGQVGTAHDNTLLMLFAVCYSWIMLVGPDYEEFRANTSIITFGDDLTFTVSDELALTFNGPAMAQLVWDDLGFVFESPDWNARPFYELGFLSMHFILDEKNRRWVHRIDRDKLYSNVLQGGTDRTPQEQLQRLCGMRNVAWGHLQMRRELQELIDEYIFTFDPALKGDFMWEQAKKSYVNDRFLARLYFGFESGGEDLDIDELEAIAKLTPEQKRALSEFQEDEWEKAFKNWQ